MEAIDGARENAALAGEQINFIHRDFFDFKHDYLFDEIVTNMPVRGKMTREQLDRLYEKFFRKALTILEKEAVIVMYTGEIGFVKKQLRLHREFSLLEEYCMQIGQDKKVHIHCNVCNTGNVAGAEVVQCYYETLYASVVRPKKELVRFRKVFLEPGEKKDVDFFIDQEEFSYYGKNMETVSSGMKLRISIGNSSDHLVSENIIQA